MHDHLGVKIRQSSKPYYRIHGFSSVIQIHVVNSTVTAIIADLGRLEQDLAHGWMDTAIGSCYF